MYRLLIAINCILFSALAHAEENHNALTIITYNIRTDWQQDGPNNWQFRRDNMVSLIKDHTPHIIGLQEVRPHQMIEIKEQLGDHYISYGVGREDGQQKGESAPLFFLQSRFKMIKAQTLWCSPSPNKPSKGWDSAYNRTLTIVHLHDKQADRSLYAINTHFDHVGIEARRACAAMLLRQLQSQQLDLAVVMGDFNFDRGSPPYKILNGAKIKSGIKLLDSRHQAQQREGPDYSFNGFNAKFKANSPIDFIFTTSTLSVLTHLTDDRRIDGRYPSDHFPILIKTKYKSQAN
ncbi:endonuclease/exonuclease/phosphatase family protein [Temperatibacter marinus]|uniref:Endonuclease/exonuclease/phosphatase family protein n=1 Tax=Temperatibacter marinus TaxID=1456591 RepID=A0AA52EGI3_9PROT|nr:endonuclease/exonuclease/phosphatase family protein [Temperatibacter marinus]WND02718.1 endonuclease/exonuclease/phosphatase family protein [Temperatibacter marinus]